MSVLQLSVSEWYHSGRSRKAAHRALRLVNLHLMERDTDTLTLDSALVLRAFARGR